MNRPGSGFEGATKRPSTSPKEKQVRLLLGLVYQNVPQSLHERAPEVVEEVVDQLAETSNGVFGHGFTMMALGEVKNRLQGTVEASERAKAVLTESSVSPTPETVSVQTERKVQQVTEVVHNPQVEERPVSASRPTHVEKVEPAPLPHEVHLDTDVRELVGKAYTAEDLAEHNPFNGHGGLEDTGAYDEQPLESKKKELVGKLKAMVEEGCTKEQVHAEAVKAMEQGLNLEETYQAVQEVYNNPNSTRSTA